MRQLVPCPGCARHVRASEPTCPFCGDASPRSAPASRAVARSRTLIFGAALASTAVAGCLTHSRTDPENDAGGAAADAAVVTPTPDAGADAANIFPPYGTPPEDAFEEDAGTSNADYGGPPPPEDDAGIDAGGFAPLYGGSP